MKVIFLDRDGTINVDRRVCQIKDFEFIDGAIEGLRLLQEAGYALAVVTNQGKIGMGYCTEQDVRNINTFWLNDYLSAQGVNIAAWTYCPHTATDNCQCRKPATGMLSSIITQLGEIDYDNSWMIGDKPSDVGFGVNIGVHPILIRSPHAQEDPRADFCVDSLYEAANKIIIGVPNK